MSEPKANVNNITIISKKLNFLIFYLILLFLPTQLGKHFWPEFAFVQGLRIDYLSPTIYFTDILIGILFLLWLISNLKSQISNPQLKSQSCNFALYALRFTLKRFLNPKILIFLTFISIGIFLSKVPLAGLYGLLKLIEFVFLGFYIKEKLKTKMQFEKLLLFLTPGILFESFLSIAQFLKQSSINGIFYFFGERSFNSLTAGIANANLNGELVLRPYGTFPHPNVLAGYLLIVMTLIISKIKDQRSKTRTIFFLSSLAIGSMALFLTMSRIAIILWIIVLFLNIKNSLKIKNFKFKIVALMFIYIIAAIFLFSPLRFRFNTDFFTDESTVLRMSLIRSSVFMIKDNLFFGVGVNNYLVNLPNYSSSIINPFQKLQPVHNIYLLIVAQTGIVGLLLFLVFIAKTIKQIKNQKSKIKNTIQNSKLQILLIVLILGMFDHYFLTIQQGQLLLTLVFALCFSKFDERI